MTRDPASKMPEGVTPAWRMGAGQSGVPGCLKCLGRHGSQVLRTKRLVSEETPLIVEMLGGIDVFRAVRFDGELPNGNKLAAILDSLKEPLLG